MVRRTPPPHSILYCTACRLCRTHAPNHSLSLETSDQPALHEEDGTESHQPIRSPPQACVISSQLRPLRRGPDVELTTSRPYPNCRIGKPAKAQTKHKRNQESNKLIVKPPGIPTPKKPCMINARRPDQLHPKDQMPPNITTPKHPMPRPQTTSRHLIVCSLCFPRVQEPSKQHPRSVATTNRE
jgi:hypothetical protein